MKKRYLFLGCVVVLLAIVSFEKFYENQIDQWFPITNNLDYSKQEVELVEQVTTSVNESNNLDEEPMILSEHERLMGLTAEEIKTEFGEPDRVDLSAYGYDWWIYSKPSDSYIQIGIEEEKVVTVFLAGTIIEQQFSAGQSYQELNNQYKFKDRVDVRTSEGGVYQFELTNEDIRMRPVANNNGYWVQFYFDTYTDELSSIRMVSDDVLVRQIPYSVTFMGKAPERPNFSADEWKKIEDGNARQIFDYTNIIRTRHNLDPFLWEEDVATIAYLHSKDMSENNYFSHTSPTNGEVLDRFQKEDVPFRLAGENIAAMYIDGIASVEGWLNSEGHRVNLLHEEFTHLGVGVFQEHYTQNFMTPWQL